jgi:hypothetical protein
VSTFVVTVPGAARPAGSEPVNLATGQVSGTGPAGAEARAPPAARLRRPADKIDPRPHDRTAGHSRPALPDPP